MCQTILVQELSLIKLNCTLDVNWKHGSTEIWNIIQNEKLDSKETKENVWTEVITDRHKRIKWLEINHCK